MENKKDASALLKETISLLEIRQAEEGRLLKEHMVVVHDKLKPINLINNVFEEIASVEESRKGLINRLIGVFTGYLTQRIVVGSKAGLLKKLTGILLNYGVTAMVSKYAETFKMFGLEIINRMFGQRSIEESEPAPENKI